jgi:hypothetical protein
VLAIVFFVVGSSDDSTNSSKVPPPPKAVGSASLPAVGIRLRRTRGWSVSRSRRRVELRSKDRTVAISVSSPAGARSAAAVLREAVAETRQAYGQVRVQRTGSRRLGGKRARTAVLSVRNRRKVPLRILDAAAQGRRRAWLVEVLAVANAPAARLVQGQVILGSLKLSG